MMPPTRGSAKRDTITYSSTNAITNQNSCEANVSFWKGGNGSFAGVPVAPVVVGVAACAGVKINPISAPRGFGRPALWPARRVRSECEQQQQRDQQREDAERFGHGKAEDQVAELGLRSRGIADRGGEVVAEDGADADACATHADRRDAGADVLCCDWIHLNAPVWIGRLVEREMLAQCPPWMASLR